MTNKMPQVLQNLNLYVNGRGHAGRIQEITLPKLTIKTEEFHPGGFDTPIKVDMGMEAPEAEFTVLEYDESLFALFGLVPDNMVMIFMRGAFKQGSETHSVVVALTGSWHEIDMGTWKKGETGSLKVSLSARKYQLLIDGNPTVTIDIENNIRAIGTTDYLEGVREFLGSN